MNKYDVLKQYFGYDVFRKGQETLIDSILSGKDAVGVMPTGAGKSLCFQIPALLLSGITLVVSPLISLMRDQVMSLCQAGVPAAYLNSSLTFGQYRKATENMVAGKYKIIYIAPERLLQPDFLQAVSGLTVSLLAVDEAHCISQWGKDFRPEYTNIPQFAALLPHRPVIAAFTATATGTVKDDIIAQLRLHHYTEFTTSFDRPNLYFAVQQPRSKNAALLKIVKKHAGESGIVYCSTRKTVESVCEFLVQNGCRATRYHAGLTPEERLENQEVFLFDRTDVIVATNAFSMGIDKSNVRFVVHYNMPLDLESYYQEAGRAGRDGFDSECTLLYGKQDVMTGRFLLEKGSEAAALENEAERQRLLQLGYDRLRQMTFYATSTRCLRREILHYFGENAPLRCENCSVCLSVPREDNHIIFDAFGAKPKRVKASTLTIPSDPVLYEKLRTLRTTLAKRRGVPAFVVCTDVTLLDMCAKKPQTKAELHMVSGIGAQKVKDYGDDFLKVLRGD